MKHWLILTGIIVSLMLVGVAIGLTACTTAHGADWYAEGGVGATFFQKGQDGNWVQEGLGSSWNTRDVAFRAGLGLTVNEHWSLGLNYLDLGKVGVQTRYVADESYDPFAHRCWKDCEQAKALQTTDTLRGGELIGIYTPWQWPIAPYLRGGIAGFRHGLHWETQGQSFDLAGILISAAMGGGVCYQGWVCADVTYYKGLGSTKFPVSQDAIVPMASLRYAF